MTNKKDYLDQIRNNSAYPTYRSFVGMVALLGYLLAGVVGLAGVISGLTFMAHSFMAGLGIVVMAAVFALIIFQGARLLKEAALILADIGDSTADANSRSMSLAWAAEK